MTPQLRIHADICKTRNTIDLVEINVALLGHKEIKPRHALPQHYNTFPPIKQDGGAWAKRVQSELGIEARALKPGDVYTL